MALVSNDPKLLDDGREIPKISRKRLAVRFPHVKSPLYLTKTCHVVNYFMCFGVGMSALYIYNSIYCYLQHDLLNAKGSFDWQSPLTFWCPSDHSVGWDISNTLRWSNMKDFINFEGEVISIDKKSPSVSNFGIILENYEGDIGNYTK